jgi:hypothetical protein
MFSHTYCFICNKSLNLEVPVVHHRPADEKRRGNTTIRIHGECYPELKRRMDIIGLQTEPAEAN